MSDPKKDIRPWTIKDSAELYNIRGWSSGYFRVGSNGNLQVCPEQTRTPSIDLHELVEDLKRRGLGLPILIRFSDILHSRIRKIVGSFNTAIKEYGYGGAYRGVYPIKVNQQAHVVEELVRFGKSYGLGLEVGSKPELFAALPLMEGEGLLVCNGYKDVEYIETALLAQKLGRNPLIVIDRQHELDLVLGVSARLKVRPRLGLRAKLASKGAGKWVESSGDRSKFGLTATEIIETIDRLRETDMLDCLEMIHFHIGSQISAVRAIKDAMNEAARIFVEVSQAGAGLRYVDVGGGLGVDYDGSSTNWNSSVNYTVQEYANDIVSTMQEACDEANIPHPDIISESGRALVAYHSVLVFDILGVDRRASLKTAPSEQEVEDQAPVIQRLAETWRSVSRKNFQESYHDALEAKEEASGQFVLGLLDLAGRAAVERLFWGTCEAILRVIRDLDYVPDDLEGLEKGLADTYFGNFSVFQSAPDHWAVKQLFPLMPIHRLNEQPTRRGVIADLTCDSDGKLSQFIDLRDVKSCLELHEPGDKPYYLGMFLLGAYQEILGDLHNLFGDTNAVHVSIDDDGYRVDHVLEGDTVTDVLGYVEFQRHDLIEKMRKATEKALRRKLLTLEESAMLISRYTNGLTGYTYLHENDRNDSSDPLERPMARLKADAEGESNGSSKASAPSKLPTDSQP